MELNCVKTCKNKTKLSEAMKKYPCLFKLFLWLEFKFYARKNNNPHLFFFLFVSINDQQDAFFRYCYAFTNFVSVKGFNAGALTSRNFVNILSYLKLI